MLVNRESTSRIPIKYSESCSTISSAKANAFFTTYSLLVNDLKLDTRNGQKGKKGGQLSTISLLP